jgi:hypothetical protein
MFTLRKDQTPSKDKAVPAPKQRHEYAWLTAGLDPRAVTPATELFI